MSHNDINYNCAFCRNPGATNEHEYKGDFIFVMCDGCDAQYKEHPQLGPKYAYCLCNPNKPRELEIGMANSEIDASIKAKQDSEKQMAEALNVNKVTIEDEKPYESMPGMSKKRKRNIST